MVRIDIWVVAWGTPHRGRSGAERSGAGHHSFEGCMLTMRCDATFALLHLHIEFNQFVFEIEGV